MTTVRLGTSADEAQLMDLCRALHADNGLFSFNEEMVLGMLYHAFDRKGGIVGVIDGKDKIEAALLMLLSNFWYSKDTHLEELFSFVRPECRKSDHAGLLIEFAKKCSDEMSKHAGTKIPLVIGVITNKQMEAKIRLYRKSLGMPTGAFFVYNSSWGDHAADMHLWKSIADPAGRRREVPPGARVIPEEVLERLGHGKKDLGRARLDKFIDQEISRFPPNIVTTMSLPLT